MSTTDRRPELNELLCEALGSSNVYFQPPESVKLKYPAIVYARSSIDARFANDAPYFHRVTYLLTVIDPDPDSEVVRRVAALPRCRFDRHYTANNLNHDVFRIAY